MFQRERQLKDFHSYSYSGKQMVFYGLAGFAGSFFILYLFYQHLIRMYVDTFFQNQGIGAALIHFAITQMKCKYLWVLEKNKRAIEFYTVHGFMITGEKQLEEGTTEYIIKMERR